MVRNTRILGASGFLKQTAVRPQGVIALHLASSFEFVPVPNGYLTSLKRTTVDQHIDPVFPA